MPLDESEIYKLKAEAEYFKVLTKDLDSKLILSKENWGDKIKRWISIILTIISLIGGTWGILIPINSYIQEKKSMLKYQLNNQMVELLTDLDSSDTAISDRSVLLLSYYERNSLPILFYKLERVSFFDSKKLVTNISETISNIYESNKNSQEEVKNIIKDQLDSQIQKFKTTNGIDHFNQYAIYNLLFVIEQLQLNKRDISFFLELVNRVKKDLLLIDPEKKKLSMLYTKIGNTVLNLKSRKS